MNVVVKRTIVVIPFLAMLIDILSWYPARSNPQFAYVVVASGALMGISMGLQIVVSLYQMWIYPFHPSLKIQLGDQLRVNACTEILKGFGYETIPEGNGWLVKESLRSWQFLHSIDEMEEYAKEVQARHQSD